MADKDIQRRIAREYRRQRRFENKKAESEISKRDDFKVAKDKDTSDFVTDMELNRESFVTESAETTKGNVLAEEKAIRHERNVRMVTEYHEEQKARLLSDQKAEFTQAEENRKIEETIEKETEATKENSRQSFNERITRYEDDLRIYTGRGGEKKQAKKNPVEEHESPRDSFQGKQSDDLKTDDVRDTKGFDTDRDRHSTELLRLDEDKNLSHERNMRIQKDKVKSEYAKARRGAEETEYAKKATQKISDATKKAKDFVQDHSSIFFIIGFIVLIIMLCSTVMTSCSSMLSGGFGQILGGSYNSVPAEMDGADISFTRKELDLQKTIDNIETDYPDFDEYNYDLDEIEHDPFTLISYLSAIYTDFTSEMAEADVQSLFDEMYTLTLTPREEVRTRTVINTYYDEEGNPYEVEEEEEYTVRILDVTLRVKPLEEIVEARMDSEQIGMYSTYLETRGALQVFFTPLDFNWYDSIVSYYGYRKNPESGDEEFHRGIDIAVPVGTEVYAAQTGTVVEVGYDDHYGTYIVIRNEEGYCSKYAHLSSVEVSAGMPIQHDHIIGYTGSTDSILGSHLHLECMYNGEYYNPLFYYLSGNGSLYGTTESIGSAGDGSVEALIAEAERYLGKPYVWGGSTPSTGFDCSGFVCWALRESGFYDIPRVTATTIYNECEKISPSEAQRGDLIFFTKTYNSGSIVSHVGIYTGDGMMIHCGDPIKYTSINTTYWQNHFLTFARLPRE